MWAEVVAVQPSGHYAGFCQAAPLAVEQSAQGRVEPLVSPPPHGAPNRLGGTVPLLVALTAKTLVGRYNGLKVVSRLAAHGFNIPFWIMRIEQPRQLLCAYSAPLILGALYRSVPYVTTCCQPIPFHATGKAQTLVSRQN